MSLFVSGLSLQGKEASGWATVGLATHAFPSAKREVKSPWGGGSEKKLQKLKRNQGVFKEGPGGRLYTLPAGCWWTLPAQFGLIFLLGLSKGNFLPESLLWLSLKGQQYRGC